MAQISDQNVLAPQRVVKASVLKDQAGIPTEHLLIRDHGSEHDEVIADDVMVDLAQGNVFMTIPACEYQPRGGCAAPAKKAWFIDDHPELTMRGEQTGRTLRELFGLTISVRLFRDFESPQDVSISPEMALRFEDGPVFYTRRAEVGLTITVNKQTFGPADGVKPEMSGREIGNLITDQPCEVKRKGGTQDKVIPLDEKVHLHGCEEFSVIRCNVIGGFEQSRIDRELGILRANGATVDFLTSPQPLAIYRKVPTRPGYPHLAETDVLVAIPTAFPGVMLDGAYLPTESPLLGKVAGQRSQGSLIAEGRMWELVSYHPHSGGGGPVWNPSRHGVHSYYSEVLSWIQQATV